MTLIVGILYRGTVQIIADSAETVPDSIDIGGYVGDKYYELKNSSLGNVIEEIDGNRIIESSQKIYQISDRLIIAFSGLTIEGKQIIQDIETRILSCPNDEITEVLKDYFEEVKPENNEFICGASDGFSTKMITYSKNKFKTISTEGFTMIGNGKEQDSLRNPLVIALKNLSNKDLSSKEFLIGIIAMLQCLILNANSYAKGVGGFVNSALLHSNGVYWIDDTIKILYSSKNFEKGDKSIHFQCTRDQITFIKSTFIPSSIYMNSGFDFSMTYLDWKDKWLDEVLELSSNLNAEYYLLICYDNLRVTIIRNSTDAEMKYLIYRKKDDDYDIGYHPNLIDILTKEPESKDIMLDFL